MSVARPFKAGLETETSKRRPLSDAWRQPGSTVADATCINWRERFPALKGRAKFNRRYAVATQKAPEPFAA